MSFNWIEFYELAQDLGGHKNITPTEHSKFRSSVSRAYYAAFNQAKDHLILKERDLNVPQDGKVHEYVKNKFKFRTNDAIRSKIGIRLERLRDARTDSDYKADIAITLDKVRLSLDDAKRIISDLKTL